jgi:MYXO-CTERM domain-containing protein
VRRASIAITFFTILGLVGLSLASPAYAEGPRGNPPSGITNPKNPGPEGTNGPNGSTGANGPQGPNGSDGANASIGPVNGDGGKKSASNPQASPPGGKPGGSNGAGDQGANGNEGKHKPSRSQDDPSNGTPTSAPAIIGATSAPTGNGDKPRDTGKPADVGAGKLDSAGGEKPADAGKPNDVGSGKPADTGKPTDVGGGKPVTADADKAKPAGSPDSRADGHGGRTTTFSGQTRAISVKNASLSQHSCNDSEWHFVINQIAGTERAPSSITVTWSNGASAGIPLSKFTGQVAHYTTTAHLDSGVASATTTIYAEWNGQFVLSHGPCGQVSPPPPPSGGQGTTTTETFCDERIGLDIDRTTVKTFDASGVLVSTQVTEVKKECGLPEALERSSTKTSFECDERIGLDMDRTIVKTFDGNGVLVSTDVTEVQQECGLPEAEERTTSTTTSTTTVTVCIERPGLDIERTTVTTTVNGVTTGTTITEVRKDCRAEQITDGDDVTTTTEVGGGQQNVRTETVCVGNMEVTRTFLNEQLTSVVSTGDACGNVGGQSTRTETVCIANMLVTRTFVNDQITTVTSMGAPCVLGIEVPPLGAVTPIIEALMPPAQQLANLPQQLANVLGMLPSTATGADDDARIAIAGLALIGAALLLLRRRAQRI